MKKLLILTLLINSILLSMTFDLKDLENYKSKFQLQKNRVQKVQKPNIIDINKTTNENNISKANIQNQKIEISEIKHHQPFEYIQNTKLLKQYNKLKIQNSTQTISRFNNRFFNNSQKLEPSNIATPNNYKLKINDTVAIIINGTTYNEYNLKIDKNGNINIPKVGNINIANQTFVDAKEYITMKINQAYPNANIFVDLADFGSIQVQISGNSNNSGIYNLPAFSSIKDLLILSSGIRDIGSVRHIQLIRNHKIKTIDLYKVFGKSQQNDILLNNKDKIYIPKAKKLITIKGEISTPAIYELLPKETFKTLFSFASGLTPQANKNKIILTRYINNKYKKTYTLSLQSLFNYIPKNGDMIEIFPISDLESSQITINGNVLRSGSYAIPKNRSLKTLIQKAKLQGKFFLPNLSNVVSITKYSLSDNKIIIKNLDDILSGIEDVKLDVNDQIYFFNKLELKENAYVYIQGKVLEKPIKINFYSNLLIKDLKNIVPFRNEIYIDENNTECKDNENNCTRELLKVDNKVKIKRITNTGIKEYLLDIETNPYFELQAFDEVEFFDYYQNHKKIEVGIYGEVIRPGKYTKNSTMNISNLINLAGGLTKKAYTPQIELVSYPIVNNIRTKEVHKLELNNSLELLLHDDDEIFIRRIQNYNDKQYVYLEGEVKFPGKYAIENGEKLSSAIQRAGGFTKNAFLDGAIFTRDSIKKLQQKELDKSLRELRTKSAMLAMSPDDLGEDKANLLANIENIISEAKKVKVIGRLSINFETNSIESDIILENKDKLYIPTINSTVAIVGEIFNPTSFVYQKGLKLKDYLKKAGGTKYSADNKSIFIIKANGEAKKVNNGWIFKDNPVINMGEVVVVPHKIDIKSKMSIFKDITDITYKLAITIASLHTVGAI